MSIGDVDSPQVRAKLDKKIANVFPGCRAEWQEGLDRGMGFRLIDDHGRYRSNLVRIYRLHGEMFKTSWLERAVRHAKQPEDGFPRV